MAVQQGNVYSFNVLLKSQIARGVHSSEMVQVFSQNGTLARGIIDSIFGADTAHVRGPVLVNSGIYTNLAGGPFSEREGERPARPEAPAAPHKEPELAKKH